MQKTFFKQELNLIMFRVPGKEGTQNDKDSEKKKARTELQKQCLLFVGVVITLRIRMCFFFSLINLSFSKTMLCIKLTIF